MRAPNEIAEHLLQRVAHVFQRPLMYGRSAAGVDLILHYYFAIWSFVVERESDFEGAERTELHRENCGSGNFSTRYARNHPGATEADTAAYVVERYRAVAGAMGCKS
jgi:hypothetical protein